MAGVRAILVLTTLFATNATFAIADEGGVSFWLPGMYSSYSATPSTPGWSWAALYYHSTVNAGANSQFPRGGRVDVGLDAKADLVVLGPTYTFHEPIIGGQLSLSLMAMGGRSQGTVDAMISGPHGGTISGSRTESLTAFGDLLPQATLKWNSGVNNYMTYVTGDIPVGSYDSERLANLGLGHGAIDAGVGYTYFDPTTKWEASIVSGLTYNFKNPDTDYQNGVDFHVDWGASKFISDQMFVGLTGYYFQQISDDSGSGATLGGFRSRVAGIGPQLGYLFSVSEKWDGAFTGKAYWEFASKNRPEGWNVWFGLSLSPAAPKHADAGSGVE